MKTINTSKTKEYKENWMQIPRYTQNEPTDTTPDFILQSEGITRKYYIPADDETIIVRNPASTKTNLLVEYPSACKVTQWADGGSHAEWITPAQAIDEFEKAPGPITLME